MRLTGLLSLPSHTPQHYPQLPSISYQSRKYLTGHSGGGNSSTEAPGDSILCQVNKTQQPQKPRQEDSTGQEPKAETVEKHCWLACSRIQPTVAWTSHNNYWLKKKKMPHWQASRTTWLRRSLFQVWQIDNQDELSSHTCPHTEVLSCVHIQTHSHIHALTQFHIPIPTHILQHAHTNSQTY